MGNLTEMQRKYLQRLKEEEIEELAKNADIISSFKKFSLKNGLKLADENFSYIQTIGIVASYPDIIDYLCPDIKPDKEGLYRFDILNKFYERRRIAEGLLYSKDFILMAHPYYRRGLHEKSNFAPRFIELFWNDDFQTLQPYIALDRNRVRIDVNDSLYKEFDTWYGAKFSQDINSIPDGLVHLRPPQDIDLSLFFGSVYSLDIKWETKDSIKTFQAEEFKVEDVTILKDDRYIHPVRYIHAEFDLTLRKFRHFDGAIHYYGLDEYYSRRDSDFNYNFKNNNQIKTPSEKLFKINGEFNIDLWIKYTSHFMTGNPLIFEYFEGKYPNHIEDIIHTLRNNK